MIMTAFMTMVKNDGHDRDHDDDSEEQYRNAFREATEWGNLPCADRALLSVAAALSVVSGAIFASAGPLQAPPGRTQILASTSFGVGPEPDSVTIGGGMHTHRGVSLRRRPATNSVAAWVRALFVWPAAGPQRGNPS